MGIGWYRLGKESKLRVSSTVRLSNGGQVRSNGNFLLMEGPVWIGYKPLRMMYPFSIVWLKSELIAKTSLEFKLGDRKV